jgi:5-(carboxyamino)imidazole ribonucleotide synthase
MSFKRIGVIGSGQLGRMLALAGTPLDTEFVFYDEAITSPSSNLGKCIQPSAQGSFEEFINSVDVITYESENTDLELIRKLNKVKPVYPGETSLSKSQHRLIEKNTFKDLGLNTANFSRVASKEDLLKAVQDLDLPIVLKTTTMGYDGKGQAVVKTESDIDNAWELLGAHELIAESFVNFSRELSVIAVRDTAGNTKVYPIAENEHQDGILRVSRIPARRLSTEKQAQAQEYITTMLNHLEHVGVLTLELFDCDNGLVVNEMAPRVHNSGHWSMEGSLCGQFENHVRAITGMPLGDTSAKQESAAMINIIGKIGDRNSVLSKPSAYLHLYGKEERLNRKLGHINLLGKSDQEIESSIKKLEAFTKECG